MKLLLIHDPHISGNDVSLSENNTHNIFDAMNWANKLATDRNCDAIVVNGDFFDSDRIDSETGTLVKRLFKNNKMKYYFLLGNHEMKDASGEFNSLNIIDNYPNVEVIDKLTTMEAGDNCTLIFQPYTNKDLKPLFKKLDSIKTKKILFSHLEYSNVPGVQSFGTGNIDYFQVKDRVDRIFNGHIHIALESDKYVQGGCITGLNFSDSYPFYYPGVIYYDTDTDKMERIENPNAILYITVDYDKLKTIKYPERTRLRVECPNEKADEVKKQLEALNLLSYKLRVTVNEKADAVVGEKTDLTLYTSPSKALGDFIKVDKSIYTETQLKKFIDEYITDKKATTQEEK